MMQPQGPADCKKKATGLHATTISSRTAPAARALSSTPSWDREPP
jgi:hypothetical protein